MFSALKRVTDGDASPTRRIGLQLAALTVGLLCVLLLGLGVVTYLITDHTLTDSLRASLRSRAFGPPVGPFLRQAVRSDRPEFPPPTVPGGAQTSEDIHVVVVDLQLKMLMNDSQVIVGLPDPVAARQVLHSGSSLFSTSVLSGQTYLVFTIPIVRNAAIQGAAQFTLSEHQYESSMQALLRGLLTVSAIGLLASAAISGVLVRRALRPIHRAMEHQRHFVADAAHELRTPLAITRAAVELGLAAETIEDMQDALAQTQRQNSQLTRLVDDLSLLARVDSGALDLSLEPLDFSRLVDDTAAGVQILAEDRGIVMTIDAPPGIQVKGDAGRLHQLVLILLDNALKFTSENGRIRVIVQRTGSHARLLICDNGPGIDPQDLPHIFERFYRADRARSTPGTGLGLAIGRWIVQAHGGEIAAVNLPGGGAQFTVTLPIAR